MIHLIFQDPYSDEEFSFLRALVDTCGANFTLDEDKEAELERIRDTLIQNSWATSELIRLKPQFTNRYLAQNDQARQELAAQVLKLKLIGVSDQNAKHEAAELAAIGK